MSSQVRTLSKSFATSRIRTKIRLFSRVCPQMGPQVKIQREALPTHLAFKRLLSRMHQLMPLQLRIVQKPLPAPLNRTYILPLPVRHHVLSQ